MGVVGENEGQTTGTSDETFFVEGVKQDEVERVKGQKCVGMGGQGDGASEDRFGA